MNTTTEYDGVHTKFRNIFLERLLHFCVMYPHTEWELAGNGDGAGAGVGGAVGLLPITAACRTLLPV